MSHNIMYLLNINTTQYFYKSKKSPNVLVFKLLLNAFNKIKYFIISVIKRIGQQ